MVCEETGIMPTTTRKHANRVVKATEVKMADGDYAKLENMEAKRAHNPSQTACKAVTTKPKGVEQTSEGAMAECGANLIE